MVRRADAPWTIELLNGSGAPAVRVADPIVCRYLDGTEDRFPYGDLREIERGGWRGERSWSRGGARFTLTDVWTVAPHGAVLERTLLAEGDGPPFQLRLDFEVVGDAGSWRFCAPAMAYGAAAAPGRLHSFADHRLSYPLVTAYAERSGRTVTLLRVGTAQADEAPEREPGDERFPQRTDVGSLGFTDDPQAAVLSAFWPFHEGETSACLDSTGRPASAYRPVDGEPIELAYELRTAECATFAAAVRAGFDRALELADPARAALPFTLEDSAALRLASAAKTYCEWADGGAGFTLNFDPDAGYEAQARAFGASFADHGMTGSRDIYEYGFTGRQLNVALMLAERDPATWSGRAARVVDFFVTAMATPSGWVYTLFDRARRRPLFTCGDPEGPVMHYLGRSAAPGNYLRTMTEAVFDLLLNHRAGGGRDDWLAACRRFADFLVRHQNPDGSWYRAYTPAGEPIAGGAWFGDGEAAKSATAVPVAFLLEMASEVGERAVAYRQAAFAAGEFMLRGPVARDEYRGGTLDNPNVVDKESALLAMQALLALHADGGDPRHLEAARRAADHALTWHLVWDVPNRPGTRLAGAGLRATGWGGINSIWGAGVTDVYSLFFLADFARLESLTGDAAYGRVAELAAHGCQQLLAHPGDLMGFADAGMQPEGIAFCDQGVDEGLIAKGDTWGGLGWPYTAGTFGVLRYLQHTQHE